MPLNRSTVMKKVVEIVGTNIPILEAIDLSENRLHGLDGVVSLLQKAPNTKLLYLARNKVISINLAIFRQKTLFANS